MELLWRSSHIAGGNATYVEDLYESYLMDPNGVPEQWRDYFDKLPRVESDFVQLEDIPHSVVRERFAQISKMRVRTEATVQHDSQATEYERKQVRVVQLISAYRQRGHQKAKLDPLDLVEREHVPDLELSFHELSAADFDTVFQTGSLHIGKADATLGEIYDALERTYCNTIGAEFMHIVDTEERHWIMTRMESVRSAPDYSKDARVQLLRRLIKAEGLEKSLGSKYPGTKRFGLEGGESLIPMLSEMIHRSGAYGTQEIVIGMAHRGRLNVLVNILGKNPSELFAEFEGRAEYESSGDVKYHQGFSSNVMTPGGELHLALAFNPSHLEIVSPVVEGSVRARQERRSDEVGELVTPVVVHGDAAFAGQGVVMETFQMSQTRAYKTGGTIHIVLNNQVGFTTNKREDARSTEYCTDVAKMVQAPIFHVNADDPEAVLFVTQMAVDYRTEFRKDVVIDLVCYRRRGHNEADEPSVTQPLMYQKIRKHKTTRDLYAGKLIAEGIISEKEDQYLVERYRESLDAWTCTRCRPLRMIPTCRRTTFRCKGRCRRFSRTGARWPRAPRPSTGGLRKPWPTPPCCRRGIPCALPGRTWAAAPSPTATRYCTTRRTRASISRCSTSVMTRHRLSSMTRCYQKRRYWLLSTVMPPPCPRGW
jgi:2-oxoglutarate dehydrogenase E1 component